MNENIIKKLEFSQPEPFYFSGFEKHKVHGWCFKPTRFQQGKRYPLVCIIHGGPQGAMGSNWHYRWNPQIYTAQGIGVVCINFHGSTGFGQDFTDSISGDWGGKPFQDIMLGVDFVIASNSWIDESRIGAAGASYGGYMINWINGHTDRFKCLVNHAGVLNITSMFYNTEELFFMEYEFKGRPWDSELYEKFSPHKFVDKWKTPTLVIHGGKDYRVPESEGFGTFTALQRRGIPSEFLYFPDENHWVLNSANAIVFQTSIIQWLKKWLA